MTQQMLRCYTNLLLWEVLVLITVLCFLLKKSNHIRSVGTYVASKIKHYRFIYAEGNA